MSVTYLSGHSTQISVTNLPVYQIGDPDQEYSIWIILTRLNDSIVNPVVRID